MTTVMTREGRWSRSADVSSGADAPTITPNRRRLDRDSPNLSFTLTSRKRFVEVIVATERALFDPGSASRRTPHSFFASRAFGLTHMSASDATYIVPTAVLRGFLEAQPRPREIFFTAIAYDDQDGHAPVLAQPLAQLLQDAPSVPIAADYTVQGLTRSFGMALERLVRHHGSARSDGAVGAFVPAAAAATAAPSASPSPPSRWQATGEIRVPVPRAASADDDGASPATVDVSAFDADGFERDEPGVGASAYGGSAYGARGASAYGAAEDDDDVARMAASDVDYDDGFGGDDDRPVGAEPAELPDDDYATSYGDEADLDPLGPSTAMDAAPANGAPANGAPALTPAPARAAMPSATQLANVLARVAATLDGHSLYTMARRSDAGLRFGIAAFDQRSGALGNVLARMKAADGAAFARFFGDAAEQLLAVTAAATPQARMADIAGKPLVDASWTQRFAAAGTHPPFVGAQNEALVAGVLAPIWPVAVGLGLTNARAVALVVVLAIHMGPQEAADWLTERLAPAHTEAQVGTALAALGAPDLAAFQRQVGLPASGRIDADTKAALTYALRSLGPSSPVPVLAPSQMLDAVRRHAGHSGLGRKLASLMEDRSLGDQPR